MKDAVTPGSDKEPGSTRLVATLGFAGLLSGLIIVSVFEANFINIRWARAFRTGSARRRATTGPSSGV